METKAQPKSPQSEDVQEINPAEFGKRAPMASTRDKKRVGALWF